MYQAIKSKRLAGFEPPNFGAIWDKLVAQFNDPQELQKARLAVRTLSRGNKTILNYVQQYHNFRIKLIGGREGELQDNFILGLCPEMKQKLQYSPAKTLRELMDEAIKSLDIRGKPNQRLVYATLEGACVSYQGGGMLPNRLTGVGGDVSVRMGILSTSLFSSTLLQKF